uniref:Uncharacterized protein n=1 Tax=Anguilla anguilla TaxID=7936 RepID=A0A0E9PG06_ANGAN
MFTFHDMMHERSGKRERKTHKTGSGVRSYALGNAGCLSKWISRSVDSARGHPHTHL